jgi:hypothetical protein
LESGSTETDVPDELKAAHRELTSEVMGREGVTGTAIGSDGGRPCLKVYVSDAAAERRLPTTVRGFRVVVEATGTFKRL